ncbi:Hypothetical predicted protein [Olea europaea subsp. europaea]|uniref:Uncharacterized protein n=1 Tax=Olea europaea subsp. europaea TaxID=158383 RepID=A0A8S0QFG1_OLEEU|nr:Hypothetical predicted protein [Olea europaea subsp. europaea]
MLQTFARLVNCSKTFIKWLAGCIVTSSAASSTPLRFDEKTLDSYNSLHVDATTLTRLSPIESKIGDLQFQMSKFLDFKSGTLAIVLPLKMKLEHKAGT